jgi:hypothetical protein
MRLLAMGVILKSIVSSLTMCHEAAEVASNNAVPGRSLSLVKLVSASVRHGKKKMSALSG